MFGVAQGVRGRSEERPLAEIGGSLTHPSSGQASHLSLLRHRKLPACHSGAALAVFVKGRDSVGIGTGW